MRAAFFAILFSLILPLSALADTPSVQDICTCTYRDVATTMVFTQIASQNPPIVIRHVNDWVPEGETPNDNTCRTRCNVFVTASAQPILLTSADYTHLEAERAPIVPVLNIPIPGLTFQIPLVSGNTKIVPFLGDYIQAVYRYLIGAGAVFAIIMIIVGGVQYMLQGGTGDVKEARGRITNALIGFALLLGSYTLLQATNPQLTFLKPLHLTIPPAGDETLLQNEDVTNRAVSTNCQEAWDKYVECPLSGFVGSPTSGSYTCNYHFRDAGYDPEKIKALDFQGAWGNQLLAPADGTVQFSRGTGANRCGNTIKVFMTNGGTAIICHAKDFVGESLRSVKRGDVIGHIGGKCCQGEEKPSGSAWTSADIAGTCKSDNSKPCSDPFTQDPTCTCQPVVQSGNTTGAHVHMSVLKNGEPIPILSCYNGS